MKKLMEEKMHTLYVRNPYRQMTRRSLDAINERNFEEQKVIFPVDVRMTDDEYLVEAFLPGVSAENLDITASRLLKSFAGRRNLACPFLWLMMAQRMVLPKILRQ